MVAELEPVKDKLRDLQTQLEKVKQGANRKYVEEVRNNLSGLSDGFEIVVESLADRVLLKLKEVFIDVDIPVVGHELIDQIGKDAALRGAIVSEIKTQLAVAATKLPFDYAGGSLNLSLSLLSQEFISGSLVGKDLAPPIFRLAYSDLSGDSRALIVSKKVADKMESDPTYEAIGYRIDIGKDDEVLWVYNVLDQNLLIYNLKVAGDHRYVSEVSFSIDATGMGVKLDPWMFDSILEEEWHLIRGYILDPAAYRAEQYFKDSLESLGLNVIQKG